MAQLDGTAIIARSLKRQGVEHIFGVMGFPIVDLAQVVQREGLNYYGFRNEQSASYAAGAVGFMTGRPGVCMTVSGPGMVHAVAGLSNAWANCWPMLLVSGAPDSYQREQGAFQEAPQLEAARPFVKLSTRPDSLARVPAYIEKCVRTSMAGRPGAVYLDLPNDIIADKHDEDSGAVGAVLSGGAEVAGRPARSGARAGRVALRQTAAGDRRQGRGLCARRTRGAFLH